MKHTLHILSTLLFLCIFVGHFGVDKALAKKGGLPTCNDQLVTCNNNLNACIDDLSASQIFPGDGYNNPDLWGVSGHGPALSFTDNGDGTFTDNNTGLMWEIKEFNTGGVHDALNTYTWSIDSGVCGFPGCDVNPNGTLFTEFLDTLNNKCDGDETTACTSNTNCTGIGNGLCGHAGYRDWRIPNLKEFISILIYDYHRNTGYGATPFSTFGIAGEYWSATTYGDFRFYDHAYIVYTVDGTISYDLKHNSHRGMAVRP